MGYFNDYGVRLDAVRNVRFCNIANNIFSISFDTDQGQEIFQGNDRQQVVEQAALRMKRAMHLRPQHVLNLKTRGM